MTVNLAPVTTRAIASPRQADGGSGDAASGGPRFEEALESGGARHRPDRDHSESAERDAAMRPLRYDHRYEGLRMPVGETARELLPQGVEDIVDLEIDPAPADTESTQLVLGMLSGGEASRAPAADVATADVSHEAENPVRKSAGNSLAPPWRGFHARGDFAPRAQDARPADDDAPADTADILSSVSLADTGDDLPTHRQESTPAAAAAMPVEPSQPPSRRAGGQPAPAQTAPARPTGEPARQPDTLVAVESRPDEPAPNARPRESVQPAIFKNGPAGNGQPGGRGAAPDPAAGRVTVLAHSTALPPAPAIAPLPAATVAGLVAAIDADPSWRAAAEAANLPAQRAHNAASATSTLRIQLNPAELGVVTARLSMSGSQLSIEIQADSNDARQRLAGDSEAIVKALRVAGIDVERVTIQQAPSGSGGGQQQGPASRDPFAANQQAQAEAGARERGGRDGAADQGEGTGHGGGEKAADRAGGGLYI